MPLPPLLPGGTPRIGMYRDVRVIEVPEIAAPGPAIYYMDFKSTCGWIRRVFNWPTEFSSPEVAIQVVE